MTEGDTRDGHAGAERLVYVLHFERALGGGARHYTGTTKELPRRLAEHRRHNRHRSSVTTAHAARQGIAFTVALVVCPASYRDERAIKKLGAKKLCPLCGATPTPILRKIGVMGTVTVLPDMADAGVIAPRPTSDEVR